jgi:serine/threonine protein kinase
MTEREKFGKLVLLEQTETTGLGSEYRAAKLGPAGLEKIVTILRLSPSISGNADVARSLMDQAKVAAQLQNPNIMKIFGIGKVEQTYYISYEFAEGKSLRAILDRCRQEAFPLQVEHALLIASKVCSALEYAQTRKTDSGRYFHGLVSPSSWSCPTRGRSGSRGSAAGRAGCARCSTRTTSDIWPPSSGSAWASPAPTSTASARCSSRP